MASLRRRITRRRLKQGPASSGATAPITPSSGGGRTAKRTPSRRKATEATSAGRKLRQEEESVSPVSGTIIITLEEVFNSVRPRKSGDIEPQYNVVEISDDVRAELAAIHNVIGAYNCKLCRTLFADAFGLAQHRCSCIVLLEYQCPECAKCFNCPANLASHQRWHKPRSRTTRRHTADHRKHHCDRCDRVFKKLSHLVRHQRTHGAEETEHGSTVTSSSEVPDDVDQSTDESTTETSFESTSSGRFTEEENLVAMALTYLRHGLPVAQRTTALAV